jgi:hypothetical protein
VDDFLAQDDDTLLAACALETFRGSGPGGQHRNKTDSGVRLRHLPSGIVAAATERRSQHENRTVALFRLRQRIALEVRRPLALEGYTPPPELIRILPAQRQQLAGRHPDFWRGVQALLDLFVAAGRSLSETAALLGVSTGQLSRLITGEPELLRAVNTLRAEKDLRPLRA